MAQPEGEAAEFDALAPSGIRVILFDLGNVPKRARLPGNEDLRLAARSKPFSHSKVS
jgi:hypothetical protein